MTDYDRRAIVEFSGEMLSKMLKLPEGMDIVSVYKCIDGSGRIDFGLEVISENLRPVTSVQKIPKVRIMYRYRKNIALREFIPEFIQYEDGSAVMIEDARFEDVEEEQEPPQRYGEANG